jgi:aminopeptidase N
VEEDTATKDDSGNTLYKFKQDVPIPSYLFALASGLVLALSSQRYSIAE